MSFPAVPALTQAVWGRRVLFALLYFAQGGPIGLVWWYLPTRLRAEGVGVELIALITATLLFPWIFKFLWAPMVDTLRGPRFGYRSWIVTMQLLMGLVLLPLAFGEVRAWTALAYALLLGHTLFAATQDVAIDAFALHVTPRHERGGVTGFMQAGNMTGRWLFGAGLLLVADRISPGLVVPVLVGVIWLTTLAVLLAGPGSATRAGDSAEPGGGFLAGLKAVLSRRVTWLGLLFAAVGGAGYEGITALAGPYLIDRGSSVSLNGVFFTISIPLLLVGGLIAGFLADRVGKRRFVKGALLAIFLCVTALAIYDVLTAQALPVTFALLGGVYLAAGAFIAASYAVFMDITDERLGGTQFSAYMGATNLCESWATLAVGFGAAAMGYGGTFFLLASLGLLAWPVVTRLTPQETPLRGAALTPVTETAA
ncbi:MAG: MFS transporter [Phycisphaerae bacterium]